MKGRKFAFWTAVAGVSVLSNAFFAGIARKHPSSAPGRLVRTIYAAGGNS